MKKRDIHRHTYGYMNYKKTRKKKTFGDTKKIKIQQPKGAWGIIFSIIWFPIALIFWLLGIIWKQWKNKPLTKNVKKRKVWKIFLWLIFTLVIFGFISGTILVVSVSRNLPDPNKLTDRAVSQSTKIYDRTGTHLLYEIYTNQKRTLVKFDQIPKQLVNAVVATEDAKFFQDNGVRPLSILRSILTGQGGHGASTITQQLVKNVILNDRQTVTRKIKEIILSLQINKLYTKDQILQIYFNEIPYGSTNYGIEAAAESYYGKHVADLNLEQIVTLAGLPQAPSYYLDNQKALKTRRNFVLQRMYDQGYIDEHTMKLTQAMPLDIQQNLHKTKAPHFVLYVRDQLVKEFGEQMVDTGGLKVITTLDWNMQQDAQNAIKKIGDKVLPKAGADNAALVALNPRNSQILALVGSRNFYDNSIDGQFDVITQGQRQPGSSMKPIIYTAAFEKGYTPETILYDVDTNFAVSGKPYEPTDYDLKERGPVSMRQALQGSLNIPAVKTLYLVGSENGVKFAQSLGYTTFSANNFGLSLVLGGGEVIPLEHADAYATLADNGVYHKPVSILRVENNKGKVLSEWKPSPGQQVVNPKTAATISNVLSDDNARAYIFGKGSKLTLPGRPVATKTGTTQNFRDAWAVGYTPSLVAAVWTGNTNNTPMKVGSEGLAVAVPIWHNFMVNALSSTPVEQFPTPPKNDAKKSVLRGSTNGKITMQIDKITGNIATSSTPKQNIETKIYVPAHSILYYVDKDDPRGPIPKDPSVDPQYNIWEKAIQNWITHMKQKKPNWNVQFGNPPTTYDTTSSLAMAPKLIILFPTPSTTLTSRQIETSIKVSSPRGVTRVSYQIDKKNVGSITTYPFNLNQYMQGLPSGQHLLTITAQDDVGNQTQQVVPFTLDAGAPKPSVSWVGGAQTLNQQSFPHTLALTIFQADNIQSITVTANKDGTTNLIPVDTITNLSKLFQNNLYVIWKNNPGLGLWHLTATIQTTTGKSGHKNTIDVTIK